ncbi:DUF1592 domain-containing protein [Thalassoroseus pseudoceratinae]|uniref:DUF1592 domain-containing protein n=1 Tax=Thalassoroseus pseudoceratinae TaxID=2713176 RepID=UPI00197E6A96|nr:DUF1592 domain-containing protein [Thalassoroseus pseudoceratinae]
MQHRLPTFMSRLIICSSIIFASAVIQAAESVERLGKQFSGNVKPFLEKYCITCHDAEAMISGVRVDHLDAKFGEDQIKLWQGIRRQLDGEKMPPDDEPRPSNAERRRVVNWIDEGLEIARSRPVPKNGGVRRLTVAQYRNTLRQLLLLQDDLTDVLPPDAVSRDGFVNNQDTLGLSPLLLEAYFEIAEDALDRCIVDPQFKPKVQSFRVDLGAAINGDPCPDKLILGANSLLLENEDFVVTQTRPSKPFEYEPLRMRTQYRFNEGYRGNATVRGWREYDSIYHAVFADMRGSRGYPKGRAYNTVPEGLLLRPAIPVEEIFGVSSTYGPHANFKISLRELPDFGNFRVTVTAAKYNDGLLLDPGSQPRASDVAGRTVIERESQSNDIVTIPQAGVYQIDIETSLRKNTKPQQKDKPSELTLRIGRREFIGTVHQPAFLVVRLPKGKLPVDVKLTGPKRWDKIALTPLSIDDPLTKQFETFEKRSPQLGVHLGLRRDCGSTLARVGSVQTVSSVEPQRYVFEGAISNFPSPEVEKDNVNYLAGIREIGVRSEYTDGRDMPRLLIRSVEFEGPYYETWPPAPHRNLFIDSPHKQDEATYARDIIRTFATRAFRRPVLPAEMTTLVSVFEESHAGGRSFQNSVRDALQVVLTSPQFLFLIENSHTPKPEPIDDYELASKLSYFLWNGPPDHELLALAKAGELRSDLDSQVARLIADERFENFVGEFASQWLALEKFDVLEPDRKRFPKLTREVREHLRNEPMHFLKYVIRQNLSVRNLIQSDFVVANEVVGDYYGLLKKSESGFQFVAMQHDRPDLGGVFGQAAIMAGLSDGREANPVKRGAWLARKIIAEPPDDPPPNVPALEESTEHLPLRERLAKHRNQPGCVQCHTKIDPWGIPFEQYDAAGKWKSQSVDAHSTLPDHTVVDGVQDLKRYLAEDRLDQVAFSVLKHLAIYATGRDLTYNELETLRQDQGTLKLNAYRFQDMIRFVVQSPMFLEK